MLSISRLLLPVDFSTQCAGMLRYVKPLAERYGAEVILVHVVKPVYVVPPTGMSGPTAIRTPEWVLPQRTKQLNAFARSELNGLPVRRMVCEGEPEVQICALAERENVDWVVMPTHGYGVVRRFLIGSVTAKVLHDVSCPVLTGAHIEPRAQVPEIAKFSNVVCAIDLSPHSVETLTWASRIAADFAGLLSLVHVIPRIATLSSAKIRQQLEQMAHECVEELQAKADTAATTICIQEGDVARGVCSFAASMGADLVVAGRSPRHNGFGRLRTNAYAIIREAPCPVLSV